MPVMQITWFGHSAFRLDFAGHAVLIDPFFTGNLELLEADYVRRRGRVERTKRQATGRVRRGYISACTLMTQSI
jgi:hypothetical protein